jgi:DNA (cytosine-5)-methyltransferase 1
MLLINALEPVFTTKMKRKAKIKTVELFSGAGLMSEGFRRHGFGTVLAAEADPRAVQSFNRNVANVAIEWDVQKVRKDIACDVIVAGPPCQGFSSLGKRQVHDERNRLSLCVVDWARHSGADVVVIENVPQFLRSSYWETIKRRLSRQGFESTSWILDAADFGAPQRRVRGFGILSKIGLPAQPKKTVKRPVTVREAFQDIPIEVDEEGMHVAPAPSEIAAQRFTVIPPGGDKRDILRAAPDLCPPSWARMGAQAVDVWGRMEYDKPANTIRCAFQNASKGRYIHPLADRVISLREGARLQGVPDHWTFVGDRSSIARQIGNGVPIPLAAAVAKAISTLF